MTIHLPDDITLGILAGGQGSRLGGLDKAWLHRDGLPQVLRWQQRFQHETAATLISSNRPDPRWQQYGLSTVPDRHPDCGPLSGLEVLTAACTTPWLLSVPVDLVQIDDGVLQALIAACTYAGAAAEDRDGPQPLLALWRVQALATALPAAFVTGDYSIRRLQLRLEMGICHWRKTPFGNLNNPHDIVAASVC